MIQIQVWDRKHYANKARQTFERREVLAGLRGTIVDRNEEVLAKSMPVASVFVDLNHLTDPLLVSFPLAYERASAEADWETLSPQDRKSRVYAERSVILKDAEDMPPGTLVEKGIAQAVSLLARPLGMKREDMHSQIKKAVDRRSMEFCLVKDRPADDIERVREIISKHWLEGFFLRESFKRWYTSPDLATHVVGFTGEQEDIDENGRKTFRPVGKFGIESALEEYLAGSDGWQEHRRAPNGARIPGDTSSLKPPRAGLDVQLTLDMGVQAIVEEELDAALTDWESKRGCIIVMDPKTSEILGMASRPHFNLNTLKDIGKDQRGMNFAMQAIYEPGSTIKIVAAAAAMNERLVTPQTSIFCHNGLYQQGKVRVPDHHPYGYLSVEGVLAKSSNIGAYKLGQQLGSGRFYEYMADFGFGKKSGILLSGESRGVVRNSGNPVDFSRATYGYALAVTPLQVASAYCAIASDGKLRKPHIVKSITANNGVVVEEFEPEVVSEVLRPETAKAMRGALQKVVDVKGTALQAKVPGYSGAGKTGTAVRIEKGRYQAGHYTVSYAGMLPAKDPAFVCVVVIDDPLTTKVSRYGGTIAAPVFAKVGTRLAAHMNLTPDEPVEEKDKDKLAGTKKP
ncbi:penicillin-binding protein 2 [Luteolibacter flavescens]|uniref:Penicillin-binding protein 2 n=1 Tax=Luteolibacter flavescens TaxID=1859460 RepID=A0ABT3FMN1_9BACT|nr:penicillin-binding protein 2 [Luteolibacter flavescens]MCW1884832.1 penicillin-binding protein 2 [Luteolibacter flavescens]